MKKYMRVCLLALALLALIALPAFAGYSDVLDKATNAVVTIDSVNTDKLSTVQYTDAQDDGLYLLLVLDGNNTLVPTEENILYVEQAQADGTTVTFTNDGKGVYPSSAKKSTVCLAGPGLDAPIKLANLDVSGVTVSGTVTSCLNETDDVTIRLMDGETEVAKQVVKGNSAEYSFSGVATNEYTLEVSKKAHATYIETIVVEGNVEKDVVIALIGDINIDKTVDIKDLLALRQILANNLTPTEYQKVIADILEDDIVDIKDLLRLRQHLANNLNIHE